VQKAVSRTTFSLPAFQRGVPMSIYLVLPATRLHSHAGLLRIWLAVLLGLIAERKDQPELPTLLVLDELAQIGGMQMVLQALTLLRGCGVRVMAVLQSLGQLQSMWPRDFQTVLENCGPVLTFGQNRPSMAAPMANLFGDVGEAALIDMAQDEMAIGSAGRPTVLARKLDYLTDPMFAGRFDDNDLYRRPADALFLR
jgi:type IV secretion system protein VirD4